jgi:hypothetical protein
MRHRFGPTLAIAIAIVATLAPRAGADARQRKASASARARAEVVTFSGACSGAIAGEMRVAGLSYRVSPNVRIYEIGRGVMPGGTAYYDRVVTVSGIKVRDTFVVQSVVVRPETWPSSTGATGIEPESGPR